MTKLKWIDNRLAMKEVIEQRKKPQWHVIFKMQFGRYPNQFEVFMKTAIQNSWI